MDDRFAQIRDALAAGPVASDTLRVRLQVSRATLARAIGQMAGEIVRIGAARATRYALRDRFRPLPDIAVYRVPPPAKSSHWAPCTRCGPMVLS